MVWFVAFSKTFSLLGSFTVCARERRGGVHSGDGCWLQREQGLTFLLSSQMRLPSAHTPLAWRQGALRVSVEGAQEQKAGASGPAPLYVKRRRLGEGSKQRPGAVFLRMVQCRAYQYINPGLPTAHGYRYVKS